jgi:hypothetical protein
MAGSLGSPDIKGAIVASVVDSSPAAKAGLKQGDVIVSVNGSGINDCVTSRGKCAHVCRKPCGLWGASGRSEAEYFRHHRQA